VVQTLIEPDYAGVILLRNPSNETELLIEYVEGHAEKIVSGEVNPIRFHVHYFKYNGKQYSSSI
jgi:phosphoenolpyruvate synthase/pyruvate phosphate dikinase